MTIQELLSAIVKTSKVVTGISVGANAIYPFTSAECFQNYPQYLLPQELQDENKNKIWRKINNSLTKESIDRIK